MGYDQARADRYVNAVIREDAVVKSTGKVYEEADQAKKMYENGEISYGQFKPLEKKKKNAGKELDDAYKEKMDALKSLVDCLNGSTARV